MKKYVTAEKYAMESRKAADELTAVVEAYGVAPEAIDGWMSQKKAWETEQLQRSMPPPAGLAKPKVSKDIRSPYEPTKLEGKVCNTAVIIYGV